MTGQQRGKHSDYALTNYSVPGDRKINENFHCSPPSVLNVPPSRSDGFQPSP